MMRNTAGNVISLIPAVKRASELRFWKKEIKKYQQWYSGVMPQLYNTPSPIEEHKAHAPNLKDSSILTWHKLHQEAKYLQDLQLPAEAFNKMKILDIGSGPMPSATCFNGCELYCLDPLLSSYLDAGFPIHYYKDVHFINAFSEDMPIEDDFFDAVISVNAIDHVDDIVRTSKEIRRVLKRDGKLRMHVHYHPPSVCEPIHFDDEMFKEYFSWCFGLKKIHESKRSHSSVLSNNQCYVLWSNFS